jgi:hypothetical protein
MGNADMSGKILQLLPQHPLVTQGFRDAWVGNRID